MHDHAGVGAGRHACEAAGPPVVAGLPQRQPHCLPRFARAPPLHFGTGAHGNHRGRLLVRRLGRASSGGSGLGLRRANTRLATPRCVSRLAIAQQRAPAVVMLTRAFESGKSMSSAYVPGSVGASMEYGEVEVEAVDIEKVCSAPARCYDPWPCRLLLSSLPCGPALTSQKMPPDGQHDHHNGKGDSAKDKVVYAQALFGESRWAHVACVAGLESCSCVGRSTLQPSQRTVHWMAVQQAAQERRGHFEPEKAGTLAEQGDTP